jgi:hypothetical protein
MPGTIISNFADHVGGDDSGTDAGVELGLAYFGDRSHAIASPCES